MVTRRRPAQSVESGRSVWLLLDFLTGRSLADLAVIYRCTDLEAESELREAILRGGYKPSVAEESPRVRRPRA